MARMLFYILKLVASLTLVDAKPKCTTETFTKILADTAEASVNFVHAVPRNGSFGEGAVDLGTPYNATHLPALCAVGINLKSSENSSYNFGLFLPDSTWNERFLATGNGGLGGGINWLDMGTYSQYGFATMSTDTGHLSANNDGTWALNAPETILDWGHRAIHGSVVLSKEIINAYYKRKEIKYSYYAACSTGGRQGLKEIQLHPDSFDGISVGAPAWWTPHLSGSTLWQGLYNYPESDPKHIDPSLFTMIAEEMKRQCDPQDGLVDNIISDPYGCNFDFEALLCTGSDDSTKCLTPQQLTTLYKFYNDWVDTNQEFVFPGVTLGTDAGFLMGSVSNLGSHLFKYMVYNDTEWDYTQFTYKDLQFADTINPGDASADDFDLSPFLERGGKIIKYHGMVDSLIPTGSSVYFYKKVLQTLRPKGIDLDDFYRFFLVPDMNHCAGSITGPWYIAAGGQTITGATHSVPGYEDAEHDIVLAMMKWVEAGKAPDRLVATKFHNDTVTAGVRIQRPLCPYPKQAKYTSGDPNVAESWECKSLY
ncbi:feruloyl esterase B precursor [Poronia punctata]|nr:feruloyl esterase B precursor [Poronia punctata]